jgi:hypothetical protein
MQSRRHNRQLIIYGAAAAVAVAAAYLCFALGQYQAGYSLFDERRQIKAYKDAIAARDATIEELRRRLAILETSNEIDRETYSRVTADLGDLQATIQAQEEELAFYRSIVSPDDGASGLRVQNLEIERFGAERHYRLRLTLAQAIVHDKRVAGTFTMGVEGNLDGETVTLGLADLVEGADDHLSYGFRYFQTFERTLTLPVGFEPATVEVRISPGEPRGDTVDRVFQWSAVSG